MSLTRKSNALLRWLLRKTGGSLTARARRWAGY